MEVVASATGRKKWSDFTHVQRFSLLPGGTLAVDDEVRLGDGVSDVPRIGVSLVLPATLESLTWFGRGPWENYGDRKRRRWLAATRARWRNSTSPTSCRRKMATRPTCAG